MKVLDISWNEMVTSRKQLAIGPIIAIIELFQK